MYRKTTVAILFLGALIAMGSVCSSAQTFQRPYVNPFQSVTAEFTGFTVAGEARYQITIELAPVSQGQLAVHLRDAFAPVSTPQCACTWEFVGDISTPTRITFSLTAGSWFTDPVFVDAMVDGRVVSSLGPIQLPVSGSGLTPYGAVNFDRNRLLLAARGTAQVGGLIRFDVDGARPGAASLIALSTQKTRTDFSLGGTLLIGPENMVAAPLSADASGRFSVSFPIPSIPELKGVTFFTQAASDTLTDDIEPWFFSNGIQVVLKGPEPITH